jgi:transketolase
MEKLGTRDIYGQTLVKLGSENRDIVVLDADLSSSTRTSKFKEKFPERFFNMGVAEQDMMGTAAGLAAVGKIPFASTFAIFSTGRAWEQVRQAICLSKFNVKIVASHGGITVGEDGATHQSLEDIGLMKIIPNMTVIVPADGHEAAAALEFAVRYSGPVYIRLSREKFPVLYHEGIDFQIGKARVHSEGTDVNIIACGMMVSFALNAAESLRQEGLNVGVINMSSIKPIDKEAIKSAAKKSGAIVTAEEHSIIGGLGSAVAEYLGEEEPAYIERIGTKDRFGASGKVEDLLREYNLTREDIILAAKKVIAKKAGRLILPIE